MGTRYTFTTELIHDKEEADKLLKDLVEHKIEHHVIPKGDKCYIVGFQRNAGGGFYELPFTEINLVWVSDEGGWGNNFGTANNES